MRVLIVDDYPGLVELYDVALAARGFEVVGAVTASQALTLAASERFDAVVVDLQLPDAPGAELLARLRALPSLEGKPLVGMSSFAAADVPPTACDAFLAKPLHPKRLAAVLRRLVEQSPGQPPHSAIA